MDTLGKRVKKIIVYHGTTMTNFAKTLNISQSMVSKICSDKAIPSERTISDICRIYNINKDWLLHEIGEMVDKQSLLSEIAECFDNDTSVSAREIMQAMADIPPAVWPLFAEYINTLVKECNRQANNLGSYQEGFEAGKKAASLAWDAVIEAIKNLPREPVK